MQYLSKLKAAGLLLMLLGLGSHTAFAAGTASSTNISNTATVNYDVGGVAQTLIESSPTGNSTPGVGLGTATSFLVDNRVDLTVANSAGNTVTPNDATLAALTFTLTNTGNTTQNYALTTQQDGGDDFDMQNVAIYIEDGTTVGFQSAEDTLFNAGTGTGDIAADGSITVYVVGNTATIAPTNGQVANIHLQAQTLNAGTTTVTAETGDATAWAANTVQIVFGDGAGSIDAVEDGLHADVGTFTVATATLTVSKTQAVTADPFSASNPKAIPGATIQYTLTVANAAGGSAAQSVAITDVIPAGVTYNANSVSVDFGGGAVAYTDGAVDGVASFAAGTLTVDVSAAAIAQAINVTGELAAGSTATVTFEVTVTYP